MDAATKAKKRTSRWTSERIARLGFLIGAGWEPKRIAQDPIIHSTISNVHRQALRFGLSFLTAKYIASTFWLSGISSEVYDKAAFKRGLTREALIRLLLTIISKEPCLLDNIIDDGA